MIFSELWLIIIEQNPKLKTDNTVTMSIDNFKKAIKLAHNEGVKEGKNSLSVYDQLFGKRD